jgi:hypothetical protein
MMPHTHPQDAGRLRPDIAHPQPGHCYRLRRGAAPSERWNVVVVNSAGDPTGAGDRQIGEW